MLTHSALHGKIHEIARVAGQRNLRPNQKSQPVFCEEIHQFEEFLLMLY
jgi:hypothetical protein